MQLEQEMSQEEDNIEEYDHLGDDCETWLYTMRISMRPLHNYVNWTS